MRIFGLLLRSFALAIFTLEFAYSPTLAVEYYVSPTGSGSACTNSAPCALSYYQSDDYSNTKHINLVAGDKLYFKSGTYVRQARLNFSASGTAASRIIISTAPEEPTKAIISGDVNGNGISDITDGPRTLNTTTYHQYYPLVKVSGSYNTLKDLEIAYSGGRGVQAEGTYDLLSSLYIHNIWNSPVHLFGSYNTLENSTIERGSDSNFCGGIESYRQCNGNWPGAVGIGDSNAATVPGTGSHSTVKGNTIFHTSGEGILCMHNEYLTVENNVTFDNWAANIDIDKCSNVLVKGNLAYYTADKIWWRVSSPGAIPTKPKANLLISNEQTNPAGDPYPLGHDRTVINNIFVGGGANISFWAGDGTGGIYDSSSLINDLFAYNTLVEAQNSVGFSQSNPYNPIAGYSHTNSRFTNNLVLQSSGNLVSIDTISGITFNHNLWSKTPPTSIQGEGDVVASPLLADPNHARSPGAVIADWYKLTANSPAIGKAQALAAVTGDYFSTSRDSLPDIGAHEFGGATASVLPSPVRKTGDTNDDSKVDEADYGVWAANYLKSLSGYTNADFNSDSFVDGVDYVLWLNNYGL